MRSPWNSVDTQENFKRYFTKIQVRIFVLVNCKASVYNHDHQALGFSGRSCQRPLGVKGTACHAQGVCPWGPQCPAFVPLTSFEARSAELRAVRQTTAT